MKIEIILRTHDQSNVHTDRQRYCNKNKKELILGCFKSLINSANLVKNHLISIKVIDDHSSLEFLQELNEIRKTSFYPSTVINLNEKGYNHSALRQFQECRDSQSDLIYSVEDDYLHCSSALTEMIDCFELFEKNSGQDICIYPFDMPDDYVPPHMNPCYVVHGTCRHWKTGIWTTNTFMVRPKILKEHWSVFEKLAKEYSPDYSDPNKQYVHEGNTICNVWKNHTLRFSPIQSLALHMQFDTQKDPYIPWETWWDQYTK
jgi:hypothetical protein